MGLGQAITTAFRPLADSLNAVERYKAVRQLHDGAGEGSAWLWGILIAGAVAILAGTTALLIMSRRERGPRSRPFRQRAGEAGLNDAEGELLMEIARKAGLKRLDSVFTIASAFEEGAAALAEDQRSGQTPPEQAGHNKALIQSLREKLGFQKSDAQSTAASVDTRQIPDGAHVSLIQVSTGRSFEATVADLNPTALVLRPDEPVECQPGEPLQARYSNMGTVWEFETETVQQREGKIFARHTGEIRFINRRRFPRVPTRREGYLAAFPFLRRDAEGDRPEFVPATLMEIAGPGLLFHASLQVPVGQRVIAVARLREDKTVEALGKVRRAATTDQPDVFAIAVELVDLNGRELTELSRETRLAAKEAQGEAPAAEEPGRQAPAAPAAPPAQPAATA